MSPRPTPRTRCKVRGTTTHTPAAIEAARAVDGAGLRPRHTDRTVEDMLEAGAIAIGELGGGQTMGGGGQDLRYIPDAVERTTGVRISSAQARALKEAALGAHLDAADFDPVAMAAALRDCGLHGILSPARARALIAETVLPSFTAALQGLREGGGVTEIRRPGPRAQRRGQRPHSGRTRARRRIPRSAGDRHPQQPPFLPAR